MTENNPKNSSLTFFLFVKQRQDETVCYGNHVKSSQCAPTVRSFATTQSKVKLSVRDLGCATYQTTASPAWLAKNRPLFVKYCPEIFHNFDYCDFVKIRKSQKQLLLVSIFQEANENVFIISDLDSKMGQIKK